VTTPWTRAYRSTQLNTASPGQLVVMLYDGALRFVHQARDRYRDGDPAGGNAAILRAEKILLELMSSLDLSAGGALAASLLNIYQYLFERVASARREHGGVSLDEVARLLSDLRGAWADAERQLRGAGEGTRPERAALSI
jgi:flagellar protein FliS